MSCSVSGDTLQYRLEESVLTPCELRVTLSRLISCQHFIWNRADHYIFMLWFVLSSSFFPRLISAAADWMSAIHMVWP